MHVPTLRGERILLRALAKADSERLVEISRTPEVARWWQEWNREYAEGKLEEESVACWIVELDGEVIGFAQAYEESDPEYRHAGIDLFLDPKQHGRGLGQEVVRVVARYLLDTLGHHRLVIDPAVANVRAIRCYEAVGFRRVGVARASWWDHVEEGWADGLLLDLLRGELT